MVIKLVAVVVLFATCAAVAAEDDANHKFLSWYNGWGSHNVWGLGSVTGSYSDAYVKCGEVKIKVVPIYDTHSMHEPPNESQSSSFAKAHNLVFAEELAKKGVLCKFENVTPG